MSVFDKVFLKKNLNNVLLDFLIHVFTIIYEFYELLKFAFLQCQRQKSRVQRSGSRSNKVQEACRGSKDLNEPNLKVEFLF